MPAAPLVDLRSDTVTRPVDGMYDAMRGAVIGDDVYGEDETVNRLEARAAELLGKEAGLFVSSATQANLIAMLVHNARGEEILLGEEYHVFASEAGGSSALGGIVMHPLPTDENGALSVKQILSAIKEDDYHNPITRTLVLENTVSGRVQDPASHGEMADAVRAYGIKVHLDGARLMNAAVALGVEPAAVAAPFDSVMLCLSKGLGCPVGALLCGPVEFIARARRQRKQLGGGMRQAGVLAACGLYALEHHIDRLADDHALAQRLADGLDQIDGLSVRHATNMVFIEPDPQAIPALQQHLLQHGVNIGEQSPRIRLVTHLDLDAQGIERAIDAFQSFYRR